MKYLPLFHNLRGSHVLVVGGGEIALRKSRLLADAGALLRVVAPEIEVQLRELVQNSGGELLGRGYQESDLDGCGLIIAATDDETLNAQVSADAHRRCVPVNVVDAPALCSVIFPAIVDRSPLIIAVSSGGDAPVLARLIRAKIETWIPSTYGQLAGLAARFRDQVKGLFPDVQQRRGFWEDVFQGPIADRQLAGQGAEAERLLQAKLAGKASVTTGEVYLVGAGPGDPELLTLKAVKAIAAADVLLVDDLVNLAILAHASPSARIVPVGKRGGCRSTSQEFIERLMVAEARAGRQVVRLKGGDPFIFGRGGEERAHLMAEGIEVEVINGISSGLAAPSSIGVPLTHRDWSSGAIFVTGHERGDEAGSARTPDWALLAQTGLTLVIYMGVARCRQIQAALLAGGKAGSTPVAVIQSATGAGQTQLLTTLADLADDLAVSGLGSPSIIVIGDVVRCADIALERLQALAQPA